MKERYSHSFVFLSITGGSILFWAVYYYFSNQNLNLSILLSVLDTAQYLIGYYIIVIILLPRYFAKERIFVLVLGVLILSFVIGSSRVYGYQFALTLFEVPFKPSISTYIYLHTTTLLILTSSSAVKFALDWLRSQKEIEKIDKERKEAELEFLKGQLNPHFLFNSINTLYGSIHADNTLAREIVIRLSDMLRYQLYECTSNIVPIEKEMEYVRNYIEMQRLRNNEAIEIELKIDEGMHTFKIPPLLIAPLIENSFKHVSKVKGRQNWISICIIMIEKKVCVLIENTFEPTEQSVEKGIGIENIRKRLKLLFNEQPVFDIRRNANIFSVKMELPIA